MNSIVVLVLSLAALAVAQPNLSPDWFSTNAIFVTVHDGSVKFNETGAIFYSVSKQMVRTNLVRQGVAVEDLVLYTQGVAYSIIANVSCTETNVTGELPNAYQFVASSKNAGACLGFVNNTIGALWSLQHGKEIHEVCVASDNSTVLWVAHQETEHKNEEMVIFLTYTPSTPPSTYFVVPSVCSSED